MGFQRDLETNSIKNKTENLYYLVRNNFIEQQVIFFGGYANFLYSKYMSNHIKSQNVPDFDVLAIDPELSALILTEKLKDNGFNHVEFVKHPAVGEIIPEHIQIIVEKDTIAFIYKPIACHSYNVIRLGKGDESKRGAQKEVRVATIDTMLNFYLAFLYADLPYYSADRILCMANNLFEIQQKNRLNQRGLLKRFNSECLGKQPQLEDIRAEKAEMFKKLVAKKGTLEYDMWFLKYNPAFNKANVKKSNDKKTIPEIQHSAVYSIKQDSVKIKSKKVKKVPRDKKKRTLKYGIIEPVFKY
jgi:hypothetical protein